LKRIAGKGVLAIDIIEKDNKLLISAGKKKFSMPLIDIEDKQIKVPELNFEFSESIAIDILEGCLGDLGAIKAESLNIAYKADKKTLRVTGLTDLQDYTNDIVIDAKCETNPDSKYAVEYLAKMWNKKLGDKCIVKFSKDYPAMFDFGNTRFILAPRVER
jgi:hypothetical protein